MLSILKAAGAILASAGGLLYLVSYPPASATTEFTEVARKLQDAHTLSFRQIMTITGQDAQTAQISYKVPGLLRSEAVPAGGQVAIVDVPHGKSLILNPADKSALLLEEPLAQGRPRKLDPAASMIEDMRRLAQKDGEPVGEKVIGDVHARGFHVKEQGQDMTVWIDPEKRLPLLVEVKGRVAGLEFHMTLADIRLDPKLDESLFVLDPPAGYALRKMGAKLVMTAEEAVVRIAPDLRRDFRWKLSVPHRRFQLAQAGTSPEENHKDTRSRSLRACLCDSVHCGVHATDQGPLRLQGRRYQAR